MRKLASPQPLAVRLQLTSGDSVSVGRFGRLLLQSPLQVLRYSISRHSHWLSREVRISRLDLHLGVPQQLADHRQALIVTFAGQFSIQMTMERCGHLFPSPEHQKAMTMVEAKLLG